MAAGDGFGLKKKKKKPLGLAIQLHCWILLLLFPPLFLIPTFTLVIPVFQFLSHPSLKIQW